MSGTPTVLVATDFSLSSQMAVEHATAHASRVGGKLLIVHVFAVPSIEKGEGMMHRSFERQDLDGTERQLRAIKPDAAIEFEHRLVRGEPAEELIRIAKAENASLIVMGTHGRTGLMRALMGSVAEQVLRGSSCPVLTLRVPQALA